MQICLSWACKRRKDCGFPAGGLLYHVYQTLQATASACPASANATTAGLARTAPTGVPACPGRQVGGGPGVG